MADWEQELGRLELEVRASTGRGSSTHKQRAKQAFAAEEQTDVAIGEATCSQRVNVKHYFLIKLN